MNKPGPHCGEHARLSAVRRIELVKKGRLASQLADSQECGVCLAKTHPATKVATASTNIIATVISNLLKANRRLPLENSKHAMSSATQSRRSETFAGETTSAGLNSEASAGRRDRGHMIHA
jgi:hypothetical protein